MKTNPNKCYYVYRMAKILKINKYMYDAFACYKDYINNDTYIYPHLLPSFLNEQIYTPTLISLSYCKSIANHMAIDIQRLIHKHVETKEVIDNIMNHKIIWFIRYKYHKNISSSLYDLNYENYDN